MGFGIWMWRVISSAPNLAVVETVRRKIQTTLNNICTVLTLTGIGTRDPKESIHSICDVNVSTAPPRYPEFDKMNKKKLNYLLYWRKVELELKNLFNYWRRFILRPKSII
jgi:hypothetical protein